MKHIYPIESKLVSDIGEGLVQSAFEENSLIDSRGAVTLYIKINRHDYPIGEVRKAIKEICQKAVEYYC